MKKLIYLFIASGLLFHSGLFAQDSLSNGKALNIPMKKYGLSFGNSYEFSGIRINFADKQVKRVNGLNITFWLPKFPVQDEVVNGLNLGISNFAKTVQPLSVGVISTGTYKMNGLAFGGLYSVVGQLNGLVFGGLYIACANANGLSMSGLGIVDEDGTATFSGITLAGGGIYAGKAINGFSVAGLALVTPGTINGFATSLVYLKSGNQFNGLAITTGYLNAALFRGLSFAGYARTRKMHGISFAIYNRAEILHGIQIGLWNHAGNNRKGFRNLPILNLHFGKK